MNLQDNIIYIDYQPPAGHYIIYHLHVQTPLLPSQHMLKKLSNKHFEGCDPLAYRPTLENFIYIHCTSIELKNDRIKNV